MKYIFIDRSKLDNENNNKNNGNSIEERASNGIDYIGKGIRSFGRDFFRFTVFCCMLYGAFHGGMFYGRKTYTPKRIDIEQNFNSLDVILDGRESDLFHNKELSEEGSRMVFTRDGYQISPNKQNNEPNDAGFTISSGSTKKRIKRKIIRE